MTGGMLPQYFDTIEVIELCRARGKHMGPFSRHVIRQIEQQLDRPQDISPHLREPPDVAITT